MKAGPELDVFVGVEILEWHWDDDWGCLIPPHQTAKPSEMWSDWEEGEDGLFKEPIRENWASGVSYSGGTTKVILPEWSTNIAAAWEVHTTACSWRFSERRWYLLALQEIVSERVSNLEKGRSVVQTHSDDRIAWPDILILLQPVDICLAALKVKRKEPT